MSDRSIELEVLRYRPEQDSEPWYQTYTVPCPEEWVVLDALNYVKDELDRTLSFRWSCHMFVCGSCGMVINGEPKLACKAFLRDFGDKIRVEPLDNFPIERDLVIDMDPFIEKLESVKPYLLPKEEKTVAEGEFLQTPAQLKTYKQFSMCINCLLCYSACPQFGLEPEFVGPAALALAHRYNNDSRDVGRKAREDVVASHDGIWACSFVGACSVVCPKDVDPAGAIQQIKFTSAVDYFTSWLPGGGKR
jgi:fumarate reductase iron-sulfur subunit